MNCLHDHCTWRGSSRHFGGGWGAELHERDMVTAAPTSGLRTAAPACPTRWKGSRCIGWALF
eukprot:1476041-Alexandrium_andersonii.AAC.1